MTTRTVTPSSPLQATVDPDAAAHFAAMRAAFECALDRHPRTTAELKFTMAGHPARLRGVGRCAASYCRRPLAHLARPLEGRLPRLAIDLWDELETGVGCPGCTVDDRIGIGGDVTTSPDGRHLRFRRARSIAMSDRLTGEMLVWSAHGDRVQLAEQGRPHQVPIAFWHCDVGMQIMHSGLVAVDGRGVLFPGMGGSGKSTSSLCCLEAGLRYLGDDYIALERRPDGPPVGHSLYSSCYLEPDHLRRFPRLGPHAIESTLPEEDKWLVLLNEVYPDQFDTSAEIAAIALPRVIDADVSRWRPASRAAALLALAPSSIVMVAGRGAPEIDGLADLVASVPCYLLELGRDLATIPGCVRQIIDEVNGS